MLKRTQSLITVFVLITSISVFGANPYEISPDKTVFRQIEKTLSINHSVIDQSRGVPLETTPTWMSPEAYAVGGLRWADMNNDGLLDLVSVHYEGGYPARPEQTRVWFNLGDTLETTASYVSTDEVWSTDLEIADVDQNGYLDIVVANYGNNVIHFQDASGISTSPSWTSSESLFSLYAAPGDITNSGYLDIAFINQGVSPNPEQPNHMYTNSSGIPSNFASWISSDVAQNMSGALADYDEDGIQTDTADFTGDGARTLFTLPKTPVHEILSITVDFVPVVNPLVSLRGGWIQLPYPAPAGTTVSINYEFSNDLDLAVAVDHGNAKIYHNTGNTLELSPSFSVSGTGDRREKAAAWVDIDNDGDKDLFIGGRDVPSMIYFNEDGTINPVAGWQSDETSPSMSDVDFIDMDLDGDLDAACSSSGDTDFDTLWVFENTGTTLETTPSWILPYGHASSMCNACAWGDMNGDGYPDLAAAYSGAEIRIFMNEGPQGTPTPSPTPDCNNDGDVNQDSEITASDAQTAFMIALGSYSPGWMEQCAADCNGDWDVTAGDAQMIFMAALGSGACADPME